MGTHGRDMVWPTVTDVCLMMTAAVRIKPRLGIKVVICIPVTVADHGSQRSKAAPSM